MIKRLQREGVEKAVLALSPHPPPKKKLFSADTNKQEELISATFAFFLAFINPHTKKVLFYL